MVDGMVFPYAVCMVQDQHYYLRGVMEKYLSWLRPDTQPAPHDLALNCVSVHRYPGCQILSHQLFSGGGTCAKWMVSLRETIHLQTDFIG